MRLVTFNDGAGPRVGVQLSPDGPVADVSAIDPTIPRDMKSVLEGGDEAMAKMAAAAATAERLGSCVTKYELLAPITNPEKVMCIGMNYVDHCTEQGFPIPKEPIVFSKFSSSVVSPTADVVLEGTQELDFEVELVIVIGKKGRRIKRDRAMEYVAGFTVAHDVSARDWQLKRNGGQWLMGKTMDTFCPIGPCIVTKDSIDAHNVGIRCRLNGETVQDSNTQQLIFKTEYLLEFISKLITLNPGDIILTGTPPGVGCFRKPPLWLKVGDKVECEVDGIGVVSNRIVAPNRARL